MVTMQSDRMTGQDWTNLNKRTNLNQGTVNATVPFLFAVTVGQRTLNPSEQSIEGSNPFRCRKYAENIGENLIKYVI